MKITGENLISLESAKYMTSCLHFAPIQRRKNNELVDASSMSLRESLCLVFVIKGLDEEGRSILGRALVLLSILTK